MKVRQPLLDRLVAWSPALLLGALVAMTYWLDAQVRAPAPKFDGSGRHDPDITIQNFKATSLDDKGRIHQALIARAARHYPDDDSTDLEGPEITFNDPGKPRLTVTADKASVSGDRDHVAFTGTRQGRARCVVGYRERRAHDDHQRIPARHAEGRQDRYRQAGDDRRPPWDNQCDRDGIRQQEQDGQA